MEVIRAWCPIEGEMRDTYRIRYKVVFLAYVKRKSTYNNELFLKIISVNFAARTL